MQMPVFILMRGPRCQALKKETVLPTYEKEIRGRGKEEEKDWARAGIR